MRFYRHETSFHCRASIHGNINSWHDDWYGHVRNRLTRIIATEQGRNSDIQKNSLKPAVWSCAIDATDIPDVFNYGFATPSNYYVVPIYADMEEWGKLNMIHNKRLVWGIRFQYWKSYTRIILNEDIQMLEY